MIEYIDLFAGIGGFRIACEQALRELGEDGRCVFSSEIDRHCQKAYADNFGERPTGDITKVHESDVPKHDLLLAGFPCQPFSIIGEKLGFEDTRGTLFFDIARIVKEKKPSVLVLENVKLLSSHNNGKTLRVIKKVLQDMHYSVDSRIFNALDFGLPQKRERTFIVAFKDSYAASEFCWPSGGIPMKPLAEVLEDDSVVPKKFWASDYIREKRKKVHKAKCSPSVWHENKAGNICSYPYSCALRAYASYNYLLVNGERRFTPREMLRLQGYPESFKITCSDSQTRTQAGNSLPIPVARAVIVEALKAVGFSRYSQHNKAGMIPHDSPQTKNRRQNCTSVSA